MRVSRGTLKALAALTWYIGAGVLLYKGSGYVLGALREGAALPPVTAGVVGVVAGLARGRTMFLRACRGNLARIDALEEPRVWQFFRPGFFAALLVMIAGGAVLAWLAGTGYWGSVVVGGLELVIGTALLTSSVGFWRRGEDASSEATPEATASQRAAAARD